MNITEIVIADSFDFTIQIGRYKSGKRTYSKSHRLSNLTDSSRKRLQALAFLHEWIQEDITTHSERYEHIYHTFKPVLCGTPSAKRNLMYCLLSDAEQDELYRLQIAEVERMQHG